MWIGLSKRFPYKFNLKDNKSIRFISTEES